MTRNVKPYIIFIFFFLLGLSAFSQSIFKGTITHAYTNSPIQHAYISIKELNVNTYTGTNGNFEFKDIPKGDYHIKVKKIGFQDTVFSIKLISETYIINLSLTPGSYEMDSVIVTATRTEKNTTDLPVSIGIINRELIQSIPAITADEYLVYISGINISRHFGIFYKTGDVTMRGLNRNVYTLLLIDGIPASIVDGGAANWNRINPENIRKVEVIKGPNSSLYGSNAMGGVINIITKKPTQAFKGDAKIFYGTYNTFGGSLNLSGSTIKNEKGFYWATDGFVRRSNGYVLYPDSLKESTDVATYLNENNLTLRSGFQFNKHHNIEMQLTLSDNTMGAGRKIFEEKGNYERDLFYFWNARYNGTIGKAKIYAAAFYKYNWNDAQKESIKQNGSYTFLNTYTNSNDKGLWCNVSIPFKQNHTFTFGLDSKIGKTTSSDIYRTSTDTVTYQGNLDYYGLYLQDDIVIIKNKLKSIVGIRSDLVNFYNPDFYIDAPSGITSFMLPYLTSLKEKNWKAISPKAGLLYKFNDSLSVYLNFSKGFRSATLSDMCKTGDVNKGFKLANPDLKPEFISNIESGVIYKYKNLEIESTVFYSIGKNFQYFVGTGDSIYTTKTKKQPVIKRENISRVEIYGAEISMHLTINSKLSFFANYTFNHSQIKDFDTTIFISKNLTDKFLIDVPTHRIFSGFIYKSNLFNASMVHKYVSASWADDENTIKVKGYSLFDAKISKKVFSDFNISIIAENIFNTVYLDSKGMLPPGRFFLASIQYSF